MDWCLQSDCSSLCLRFLFTTDTTGLVREARARPARLTRPGPRPETLELLDVLHCYYSRGGWNWILNTTHQPPITDSFNDTELLNFGTMQNRPLINGIFHLRPDYSHLMHFPLSNETAVTVLRLIIKYSHNLIKLLSLKKTQLEAAGTWGQRGVSGGKQLGKCWGRRIFMENYIQKDLVCQSWVIC